MTRKGTPPPELLGAALEAILFAAGEPVKSVELATTLGVEGAELEEALDRLAESYRQRDGGLEIEKVAGGFRLATRTHVGEWVRRFFRQRNRARLSPAALETLAIIAYRQPVTAPEVQAIRGVDPSGPIRSLLEKRMIRISGKKKVVGSPFLYGTTRDFLMHFGLDSLDDLPSIEEFEELLGGLVAEALPEIASAENDAAVSTEPEGEPREA